MGFLTATFWGVRIWILLYLALSFITFLGVVIYFKREAIRKKYYQIRYAEKILKVVVHYKSNLYKVYWRIIPDKKYFLFEKKLYNYDDKHVIKAFDFFTKRQNDKQYIEVEGKKYNFMEQITVKNKGRKYPEIHYYFNNPNPIDYDFSNKKTDLSGKQLEEFKENDLFSKLLTLEEERNLLKMILLVSIGCLIGVILILGKLLEWF